MPGRIQKGKYWPNMITSKDIAFQFLATIQSIVHGRNWAQLLRFCITVVSDWFIISRHILGQSERKAKTTCVSPRLVAPPASEIWSNLWSNWHAWSSAVLWLAECENQSPTQSKRRFLALHVGCMFCPAPWLARLLVNVHCDWPSHLLLFGYTNTVLRKKSNVTVSCFQSHKERDKLTCYYKNNLPTLLLKPIKVERLNLDPDLYLLHDALTDKETEHVKKMARPQVV